MEFVKFIEINDHEGETWVFWLQRDGNEVALNALAAVLSALTRDEDAEYEDASYQLDLDQSEDEAAVDVMVRHAPHGYLPTFTKVTGRLVIPADLVEVDRLYKGGIRGLFGDPANGGA